MVANGPERPLERAPPGRAPASKRSTPLGITRPRPGANPNRFSASARVKAEQPVTAAAVRRAARSEERSDTRVIEDVGVVHQRLPLQGHHQRESGDAGQSVGVDTVGPEALHVEDVGTKGRHRAPQREQRAGAGDGRAAHGRPVRGRQRHGQATDHDPVEELRCLRRARRRGARSILRPRLRRRRATGPDVGSALRHRRATEDTSWGGGRCGS